jgi:capsular polysaccharide biosynthesis protein
MVDSIVDRYPDACYSYGHFVLNALPTLIARKQQA